MPGSSPVSAFAVYAKTNKGKSAKNKSAKTKNKKRINTALSSPENLLAKPIQVVLPLEEDRNTYQTIMDNGNLADNSLGKESNVQLEVIQKKKEKMNTRKRIKKQAKSFLQLVKREKVQEANRVLKRTLSSSTTSSSVLETFESIFTWLISPVQPNAFFENYWENGPLFIKRHENEYNQILSTKKLDTLLRKNSLFYTRNVDVVAYVDGKRETFNPEGRAMPAALWDYYENGCSIRILNPQTYCHKLHTIVTSLQEYFGCMVGVNSYLTPPNSQGFAPHYDDIEAFILQLEGRKHWKLYAPLSEQEVLPRYSSKNFDRNELNKPIKEITLEAGDLLYFPRGVIHEGYTDADAHSLHITISVYQNAAYVDLLEHILKPALTAATVGDVEYREGLPLHYLKHIGSAHVGKSSSIRTEILQKVDKLLDKMKQYIQIDLAADQMGKQFMWNAMPPIPTESEKHFMSHFDGDQMVDGEVVRKGEVHLDLKVRMFRYYCIQLTSEEDSEGNIKVYYCTDNSKTYHGVEEQFFVVGKEMIPVLEMLLNKYPDFVTVRDLPLKNDESKMQIVSDFWERGLLVTETSIVNDN